MLAQLAHPLTVTLALVALAIVLLLFRGSRSALGVLLVAFAWTWVLATPFAAQALARSLESRYPPTPVDTIPVADAIVVLGGGISPRAEPRRDHDLQQQADRIWFGADLYRAGKAPLMIVTGQRPFVDAGPTAADAAADILERLGVPGDAIVAPGRSERTFTDAQVVQAVLERRDLQSILLVTSAMHMPRALATFRKAGIDAAPAPTDFVVTSVPVVAGNTWLPDGHAFALSTAAMHEYVGMLWYRSKGWM